MAAPVSPCAFPQSIGNPAACLASGDVGAAVVAGVVAGVVLGLPAALFVLFRLALWMGPRWRKFWGRPPARLFGFVVDAGPTRAQLLWRWWLRRCWRPLLAVVRRLLLPRG